MVQTVYEGCERCSPQRQMSTTTNRGDCHDQYLPALKYFITITVVKIRLNAQEIS